MVGAFWGTTHREGPGGSGGEEDNSSPPRSERARKMVEAMDVDTVAGDDGKARDDVLYIPARGDSDLTVVLPWTDMKDAELVGDTDAVATACTCSSAMALATFRWVTFPRTAR